MNLWAIIPLVSSICFTAILLSVITQVKKHLIRVFVIYLAGSVVWSLAAGILLYDTSQTSGYLSLWTGITIASLCFVIISYYHLIRAYNNKPAGFSVAIGYALVLMAFILAFAGFIVKEANFNGYLLNYDIFPWDIVFVAVFSPFLITTLLTLSKRYNKSIDSLDRNRTLYLSVGWIVFLILSFIETFVPVIKTIPIAYLGGLINAIIITYSVLSNNPVNIQSVFRRLLTYIIVITVLFVLTSAVVFIYPSFFASLPMFLIVILLSLIYTLVILLASPVIKMVTRGIDYLFFRDTYYHRRELQNFNKKISHIINLDELAKEILPSIAKAVNMPAASLILQDNKIGNFETQYFYPEEKETEHEDTLKKLTFDSDSRVISWMDKKGIYLYPSQINEIPDLQDLPQTEKDKLTNSNILLLMPFKSRDKLIGILALGNKQNKSIMSHEDIELISNITNQAGVIIENAQLYTHARIRANTDELTGLYNHRHFHERIDQEIIRDSRFNGTFSLIMLDVDLFKSYNDIYGHLAGDRVLRKVGEYIQNSIRGIDLAFRYGGEEFAVILPEAGIEAAYKVAERIRKTIEVKTSSRDMPVTISLGIANWPDNGLMKEEIIGHADAALYRAKQMGRNRTCMSNENQKHDNPFIPEELEKNPKALSIIYALAATVDAKDSFSYGHSRKVSEYAIAMAQALDLPTTTINNIRSAGLLHDIGKINVPDYIINKESELNGYEKELIKEHPRLSVEILRHVVDLVSCIPAILHHHERFDGDGYPAGLNGEQIPVEARILAIADAYDAMVSPRPYRGPLTNSEALDELNRCAGTQFDPVLVDIFCKIINSHNDKTICLKEADNKD